MPSFDMPSLSFLPKPYKSRWKGKGVVKSPFAGRGLNSHSSSSLHPYAAPDVIDINYSHSQDQGEPEPEPADRVDRADSEVAATSSSSIISAIPSESPQVKLDIDITPEPLTEWFTSNFPRQVSEPFSVSFPGDAGSSSNQGLRPSRLNSELRSSSVGEGTSDGDDDPGTSSEDVIRGLQAIGTSDFISDSILDRSLLSDDIWDQRQSPSPIRIPNGSPYSPLYYTRRSGDFASRPQSQMSSPPSSAISGTTFARALLANTFVLSNDGRSSRYRSGFSYSGLVRSDSATLPRGEHPLSPIKRERKQSGGTESLSPGSGDVPPIPADAGLLYVPPKTPRHSGVDAREKRKRRSSTGSLIIRPESLSNLVPTTPIRSRANSIARSPIDEDLLPLKRRISKISEVTSAPQTPEISQQGAQDAADHARLSPTPSPQPLPSVSRDHQNDDSPILPPDSHFVLKDSPDSMVEPSSASQDPAAIESAPDGNLDEKKLSPETAPPSLPTTYDGPILASASNSTTNEYIPDLPTSPDSNSSYPTSPEPVYGSSEQSPSSEKASSPSDVLDYYSFTTSSETPADRGFKPAFSPISEESSSQLSPPAPYNRRESIRSPLGARTRSPMSGTFGLAVARKNSDPRSGRLPIGERPASIQPSRNSVLATSPRNPSMLSPGSAISDRLLPPPTSKIFNRQRSGSAPSPIKVVRDSKDFNAYNITVSPYTDGSSSTPPSTAITDEVADQTFPETPSAFSPILSPNSVPSTVSRGPSVQYLVAPSMPSSPLSAALPSGNIRPSLDQQILLTRAATSVHGARTHSRQMSTGGRIQQTTSSSPPEAGQHLAPASSESVSTRKPSPEVVSSASSSNIPAPALFDTPEISALHNNNQNHSYMTHVAPVYSPEEPLNVPNRPLSIHPASQASDSGSVTSSISRASSLIKPLPPISSPSNSDQKGRNPRYRPPGLQLGGSSNTGSNEATNFVPRSPAPGGDAALQSAQVAVSAPLAPSLEATLSSRSHFHPTPLSTAEEFGNLGSPPPYYSVVNVGHSSLSLNSNPTENSNPTRPTAPPVTPTTSRSDHASLGREGPSGNRRPRTRPPPARPIGPRQPSHSSPGVPGRERNASVSSVVSNPVARAPSRRQPTAFSPKFQPPSAKWRGYTMEAAKWTFTSSQLQNIVSRAIKQSAEASSIRLLRLEILDNELPRELERLEIQRADLKTKYKVLTRRRNHLLEMLSSQLGGTSEGTDRTSSVTMVDEMKDIGATLDMHAEDLHSVSEQIAQLEKLKQVHSASALSMALRKLNASFLKQVAENDLMRAQMDALIAERDEAWQQAEEVANDFDHYLNDRPEIISSEQAKRSSRISASRKSSVRVSKAGLRSSSRRVSQRSSVSSLAQRLSGVNWPPSAKASSLYDEIPPVPPIPRRRPMDIRTDLPSRSPAGLSTDMVTPTSEMRALAQVQDELYRMLGLSAPDSRLRRSRSVLGLSSPPISAAMANSPFGVIASPDATSLTRRLSMPGSSTFAEAHNAMMADRDAMLATLGMLSEDD